MLEFLTQNMFIDLEIIMDILIMEHSHTDPDTVVQALLNYHK